MVSRSSFVVLALAGSAASFGGCREAPAPAPAPAASALSKLAASPAATPSASAAQSNPETERLEARRQLYESVDALLRASELDKVRRLLDEDTARYGDDLASEWHDLEQSYRLIVDCMEHPSPQLRVRAEAFARVSQAALLKPRLLAACGAKR